MFLSGLITKTPSARVSQEFMELKIKEINTCSVKYKTILLTLTVIDSNKHPLPGVLVCRFRFNLLSKSSSKLYTETTSKVKQKKK